MSQVSPLSTTPSGAEPSHRYLDRELSWVEFNARVLALAEDDSTPLLERAKYLAIFSSNLDEFFQVRIAGLRAQVDAGIRRPDPDGLDEVAQLRALRERLTELVARQTTVFTKEVAPALEAEGIEFAAWSDLDADDRAQLEAVFEDRIYPVLTPLAVDPAHPFPYISNLSLNLAVLVRDPVDGSTQFARVKVPPRLSRFVPMSDGRRFVPLEQVIAAHLDRLFPGMEIIENHPFRVTRDADIELSDESEDLIAAMEDVLAQRNKSRRAVRLEVERGMPPDILDVLSRELQIGPNDIYVIDGPLDLTGLWALYGLGAPELKDLAFQPQTPMELAGDNVDMFALLRRQDLLVHHPYDSFSTSVEAFLSQAAADPAVVAIKQTLYRTSDDESEIIGALVKAAKAGKQVVALVELKARFDEERNIERARELEEAGVHVVYGIVGLKTHTKILLVARQEGGVIRRYAHVGTGNYNPKTAGLYEDIGVLSADRDLGNDLTELFNHLTGYSRPTSYQRLLVAPLTLREGITELIREQAHPDGRIVLKMNALVDRKIIEELYRAAAAGCDIDLIVRGICCLRAEVPGLSERIRVRSILGRYLEHSRIYRFGPPGGARTTYLIGSADLMPRNIDRRVEAVLKVEADPLRARLDEILDINLADAALAWRLGPDDDWHPIREPGGTNTHLELQERARQRARWSGATVGGD